MESHVAIKSELDQIKENFPLTMISVSVQPRVTRVLNRGDWMDTTGEVVEPGVPQFLQADATPSRRATRLDLAHWLVATNNPMTARMFVNRLWKMYFGTGSNGTTTFDDFWEFDPANQTWTQKGICTRGWAYVCFRVCGKWKRICRPGT